MSWPDEKRPEHFKSRGPSAASKRDPFAPRTEAQKGKVVLGPERPAARKRGRLIDVYRQLRREYGFGRFAALIELLDWL